MRAAFSIGDLFAAKKSAFGSSILAIRGSRLRWVEQRRSHPCTKF